MSICHLLNTSKAAGLLRIIRQKCNYIDKCLNNYYRNSRTYYLTYQLLNRVKIFFGDSLLVEFTQINPQQEQEALGNSNDLMLKCRNTSRSILLAREMGKAIYAAPIKTGSIIMVLAIAANIVLSFLLKKEIDSFGWLMRWVFLFVGINGLFCNADWTALKNDSIILRLFTGGKK